MGESVSVKVKSETNWELLRVNKELETFNEKTKRCER